MSEVPADYVLPETDDALLAECDVQVFKATGPGGQGVNTTDSAVRLIHRPTGIVVGRPPRTKPAAQQARLPQAPAQAHRDSPSARRFRRVATKPSRSAKARRLADKSQLSAKKSTRRRPASEE